MLQIKKLSFLTTLLGKSRLLLLFALTLLMVPTTASFAQSGGPELSIPDQVAATPNTQVTVPINFSADGNSINSLALSVDIDESALTFDGSDGNGDGAPDAVTMSLPAGYIASVSYDASDTDGEIDIAIFTLSSVPLPDGQIGSITLGTGGTSGDAVVGFSSDPVASFGNTSGQSVAGTTDGGSVLIGTAPPPPTPTSTSSSQQENVRLLLDSSGG